MTGTSTDDVRHPPKISQELNICTADGRARDRLYLCSACRVAGHDRRTCPDLAPGVSVAREMYGRAMAILGVEVR